MDGLELNKFSPIGLDELGSNSLMNRFVKKYLVSRSQLSILLLNMYEFYNILEINSKRLLNYETQYYDTNELGLYLAHHNGKQNRLKIRTRFYVDTNTNFLEIKKRSNTGKTAKIRETLLEGENPMNKLNTLDDTLPEMLLKKTLFNSFSRITLVSKLQPERVTFDLNLSFSNQGKESCFPNVVIVEVKQEKQNQKSKIEEILKSQSISSISFSKYCFGITQVHNNIKRNNLKEISLKINKI